MKFALLFLGILVFALPAFAAKKKNKSNWPGLLTVKQYNKLSDHNKGVYLRDLQRIYMEMERKVNSGLIMHNEFYSLNEILIDKAYANDGFCYVGGRKVDGKKLARGTRCEFKEKKGGKRITKEKYWCANGDGGGGSIPNSFQCGPLFANTCIANAGKVRSVSKACYKKSKLDIGLYEEQRDQFRSSLDSMCGEGYKGQKLKQKNVYSGCYWAWRQMKAKENQLGKVLKKRKAEQDAEADRLAKLSRLDLLRETMKHQGECDSQALNEFNQVMVDNPCLFYQNADVAQSLGITQEKMEATGADSFAESTEFVDAFGLSKADAKYLLCDYSVPIEKRVKNLRKVHSFAASEMYLGPKNIDAEYAKKREAILGEAHKTDNWLEPESQNSDYGPRLNTFYSCMIIALSGKDNCKPVNIEAGKDGKKKDDVYSAWVKSINQEDGENVSLPMKIGMGEKGSTAVTYEGVPFLHQVNERGEGKYIPGTDTRTAFFSQIHPTALNDDGDLKRVWKDKASSYTELQCTDVKRGGGEGKKGGGAGDV